MNLLKKKLFFTVTLLLTLVSKNILYGSEILDCIVAIVNQHVITKQQLDKQIKITRQQWLATNKSIPNAGVFRNEVLNRMIDDELQRQLAIRMQIKVSDTEVNKAIAGIAQLNKLTLKQLHEKLQEDNISYQRYRQQIRKQLIIRHLQQNEVAAKVKITEQEIASMLTHKPNLVPHEKSYHILDLLVPFSSCHPSSLDKTRLKANTLLLLKKTKLGISFQKLTQYYPKKHLVLFDLGWRTLNNFPTVFQMPIQGLKLHEVAGPLLAQNGFHLIRLLAVHDNSKKVLPQYITSTHTRHILIKTSPLVSDDQAKQRLKEIRADILRGGSFSELAQKYSQDLGSAYKGGDLGWTSPGALDPSYETQMNRLAVQQISLPFRTQFGWHIVQVLGRNKKRETEQTKAYQQAAQAVYQEKFQRALKVWLRHLRSQYYIKIM